MRYDVDYIYFLFPFSIFFSSTLGNQTEREYGTEDKGLLSLSTISHILVKYQMHEKTKVISPAQ